MRGDEIESRSKEPAGLNFDIYRESCALPRITERAIQIVSEASRALPEDLRVRHGDAPWDDISRSEILCGMIIIASTTGCCGKPPR